MYELIDALLLQHSRGRIDNDKRPKCKLRLFDIYMTVCQNFFEKMTIYLSEKIKDHFIDLAAKMSKKKTSCYDRYNTRRS
jgi:hypothetical protein